MDKVTKHHCLPRAAMPSWVTCFRMPTRCTRFRSSPVVRALGYTLSIPKGGRVRDTVTRCSTGWRSSWAVVWRRIFCDDVTTGATTTSSDATKMARAVVTQYMSAALGARGRAAPLLPRYSSVAASTATRRTSPRRQSHRRRGARIMKGAHDRAYEILSSHRDQMDLMASVLLERETIDGAAASPAASRQPLERVSRARGRDHREEGSRRGRGPRA